MSADDRAALEQLHRRECVVGCGSECDGHGFPLVCAECGVAWPCEKGALLAELAAAERERDQARAALARVEADDVITRSEENAALDVWKADGRPRHTGTYSNTQIIAAAARLNNGES